MRAQLLKSLIDPRKPEPGDRAILDMADSYYCICKAIETLMNAKTLDAKTPDRADCLRDAITFACFAGLFDA